MSSQLKNAIQTCTQLPDENLAIIVPRLTFEGAPGPYEWGGIAEPICDLAMRILHDPIWDPKTLHSTNPELVPPPLLFNDSIPFRIGR